MPWTPADSIGLYWKRVRIAGTTYLAPISSPNAGGSDRVTSRSTFLVPGLYRGMAIWHMALQSILRDRRKYIPNRKPRRRAHCKLPISFWFTKLKISHGYHSYPFCPLHQSLTSPFPAVCINGIAHSCTQPTNHPHTPIPPRVISKKASKRVKVDISRI